MAEYIVWVFLSIVLSLSVQPSDTQRLSKALEGVEGVRVEERDGAAVLFFEDAMFGKGQHNLGDRSRQTAHKVAEALQDGFSDKYLYIEGHTDNTGSSKGNQALSHRRANSIAEEILNVGHEPSKLDVVGYGSDHPECTNDTKEGRACNRRVQIVILNRARSQA